MVKSSLAKRLDDLTEQDITEMKDFTFVCAAVVTNKISTTKLISGTDKTGDFKT